jgi:hypothetical protein
MKKFAGNLKNHQSLSLIDKTFKSFKELSELSELFL